jgi:hypothetical protein
LEITVEVQRNGAWSEVDPATVFEAGEELRFRAKANFPSRLTVTNLGSSGAVALLFPAPETGKENLLEPDRELLLPGNGGAFRISGPPGYDVIYWIASPVSEVGSRGSQYVPLAPPPPSSTMRHTLAPRCDDGIFRARGECIDRRAGSRRLQPEPPVADNEGRAPEMRARDLDLVKRPAPQPARTGQPAAAVVYELRIAHR